VYFIGEENKEDEFRPASRSNYSSVVTKILEKWFESHIDNPYPTEEERVQICKKTNLSRKQLRVWLINSRKVRFIHLYHRENL
jgi:hypothetical protein